MGNKYLIIKRIMDLLAATTMLIPSALITVLCICFIKMETRSPAFFIQDRLDKDGKVFRIYKLRTMTVENEQDGKPLSNMERLTNVGRIIRNLSFDELPQILNILKGEMMLGDCKGIRKKGHLGLI